MALPWVLCRSRRSPDAGRDLFVEWHGSAAVVTHADDPPAVLWQLLRTASDASAEVLVMTSERAVWNPACGAVLREVVERAAQTWGIGRVWVAANGIGRPDDSHASWLMRLAARTGVELLAPDGPIHATVDGTLYAAGGTGAWGWRSFRPGAGCPVVGNRYPVPAWERALPDSPVPLPGVVADPVPAGVLLRASTAPPAAMGDPAYDIPVDPRGPAVLLRQIGDPPVNPRLVAGLFAGLPARASVRIELSLLDPASPPPSADWLDALATALDAQAAAVDAPLAVGNAAPEQAGRRRAVSPPPPLVSRGWVRASDRLYRHAAERELLAEVVPAGILLRAAGAYQPDALAFVDPGDWVLAVDAGASDRLVDLLDRALVEAGEASGLTHGGPANEPAIAPLPSTPETGAVALPMRTTPSRYPAAGGQARPGGSVSAPVSPPVAAASGRTAVGGGTIAAGAAGIPPDAAQGWQQAEAPPAVARPAVAPPAVAPPAVAADHPVSPASPSLRRPAASAAGAADLSSVAASDSTHRWAADLVGETASVHHHPTGMPLVITSSGPHLDGPEHPDFPSSHPAVAGSPATMAGDLPTLRRPETVAAYPDPTTSRYVPAVADPVEDRSSTAQEQRDLAAALGTAYTDSITTVNAALAAWPALRQDVSASAKTDFVAVHVFFGRSAAGAARLNAALRAGLWPDLPGYLPCLVSGLRRLPPYRRAMLCQGRLAANARQLYPEGGLLVEPAFRSVSGATDLAVEGADVDFLVWSRTARQAGVLAEQQELDEAVFLAGARFKVLAVHEGPPPSADQVSLPSTAVLLRELLPGEQPSTSGLDDTDRTVLTRLERALTRRRAASPRVLTDADTIDRLVGPPLGYVERAGAVEEPAGMAAPQ